MIARKSGVRVAVGNTNPTVAVSRVSPSWVPTLVTAWLLTLACGADVEAGREGAGNVGTGNAEAGGGRDQSLDGAGDGGMAREEAGGASGAHSLAGASGDAQLAGAGAGGETQSAAVGVCGDGVVTDDEACDDGGAVAGDGCSGNCRLEIGFGCDGQPSVCEPTVCGNGVQEGAETCDDGNEIPFDGCGVTCQREPRCSRDGCSSVCGDGLVIDEECDDGNARDGDGCSASCRTEPGFSCEPQSDCDRLNGTCVLRASAIYRDFTGEHPDFGVSCLGQNSGSEATQGLLEKQLSGGVPVATAFTATSCITRLSDWYSDARAKAIVRDLTLFPNGQGAFVNRYGPSGEQWQTQPVYAGRWCGNGDTGCAANDDFPGCDFDPTVDSCFPCPESLGSALDTCAGTITPGTRFDGTPTFFPIDDQPMTEGWADAKLPPAYGYDWEFEDTVVPVFGATHQAGRLAHNFFFTSRITSWFTYDASDALQLDFVGDDDLWVFVNEQLAVDLGGVHYATKGGVVLDATAATALGLETGGVYRIDIFHAERKLESSSLQVTLPGFNLSRSECRKL
jgi:fibro-slime domain-containing protein